MKKLAYLVIALMLVASFTLVAVGQQSAGAQGTIHYVDRNVSTPGDGSSWGNAYAYLTEALNNATSGDEIRVAEGTYYPDDGMPSPDISWHSFNIGDDISVYGGYPTGGGTRDWESNVTILSGEIQQNEIDHDNSYHVVTVSGDALLDGFTITGGFADGGTYPTFVGAGVFIEADTSPDISNCVITGNQAPGSETDGMGGGMYIEGGASPTITDCTFSNNFTYEGGGIYGAASSPTITNCVFSGNEAIGGTEEFFGGGGGLFIGGGESTTITDCTFSNNSAEVFGGGMLAIESMSTITGCVFDSNSAGAGAGMFNMDSSVTVSDCVFDGNEANGISEVPGVGGGLVNVFSSTVLTNCLFFGNSAKDVGGGVYTEQASTTITNCTFYGNSVTGTSFENPGGAVCHYVDDLNQTQITNCIIDGNTPDQIAYFDEGPEPESMDALPEAIEPENGNGLTVTYSDIQGGWDGEGNIDEDPLFANAEGGDFHLTQNSPCIDAGTNDAPALPEKDFDGNDRVINGTVDMGAYEFGTEPSGPGSLIDGICYSIYPTIEPAGAGTIVENPDALAYCREETITVTA
ncbi:MAG: right-handed parallel beta-helix repeat-containing protein, partial [Dehalococcoidia bacterium]